MFHIRQSSFGASFMAWLIWHNRSFCNTDCSCAIAANSCSHSSKITAAKEYCLTSRSERMVNLMKIKISNHSLIWILTLHFISTILYSFYHLPIISASVLDEEDSKNFVLLEFRFVLLTGDDVASVDGLFWGEEVLL